MGKITEHPQEIENFMRDALLAIALSGKRHPQGYPLLGIGDINIRSKCLYELQKLGYLLILSKIERPNITMAKLTDQGYDFYKKMIRSLDDHIMNF